MKSLRNYIEQSSRISFLDEYIYEHIKAPESTKAFTIVKPGYTEFTDEIYKYCFDRGFEQYDHTNLLELGMEQVKELYKMHKDKDFYDDLCKYMVSDYVDAAIWGYKGDKDPIEEMNKIKDHFRDKYGDDDMRNVMHSSDSLENVMREAKIIFN